VFIACCAISTVQQSPPALVLNKQIASQNRLTVGLYLEMPGGAHYTAVCEQFCNDANLLV